MAEENYAALYAAAIADSGVGSEVLPDDDYTVKIVNIKPDASRNGKFRVGIRLQVQGGPHDGKATWINQTWTGDNPKAVSIFVRLMRELGGSPVEAALAAGLPPEQIVTYIATGATGIAKLSSHPYGTNDDGSPRKFQDLKKFTLTAAPAVQSAVPGAAVPTPAPAPAASAPVPPVSPAQPQPQVAQPGMAPPVF